MKYILSIIIFITCSLSIHAQDSPCLQKMRFGTFEYLNKHEGTTIVRKRNKHIEYSNSGKSKLKLKIEWLNDSTYVLTHKKAVNNSGCLEKGTQIIVKIVSCDGNKYFAKYSSDKCGNGESWFIKID